jgi:hypothetical protein
VAAQNGEGLEQMAMRREMMGELRRHASSAVGGLRASLTQRLIFRNGHVGIYGIGGQCMHTRACAVNIAFIGGRLAGLACRVLPCLSSRSNLAMITSSEFLHMEWQ